MSQFSIFLYSTNRPEASVTGRLRAYGGTWRLIAGLDDRAAAQAIACDGIDILVDLCGHTSGNRLEIFALKPAPLEATYCGYPATTGLSAVD